MRPFGDACLGYTRLVRDTARQLGKEVELSIAGEDVGVDREVLERLDAPLSHLLRNALDHGLESPAARAEMGKSPQGMVRIEARHRAGLLQVAIIDDGRGIDLELVREKAVERGLVRREDAAKLRDTELHDFLFAPGFTTAGKVTEISGRGVGLDVVHTAIQELGGSIRISSELGMGTSFYLQVPITLSVLRAAVVDIGGEPYAFPLSRIVRLATVPASEIVELEGNAYVTLEGRRVGLVSGAELLDLQGVAPAGSDLSIVLVTHLELPYGVVVDRFRGEQDLVVRPLDPRLGKLGDIGAAAALLSDGTPLLIIDVEDLTRAIARLRSGGRRLRGAGRVGAVDGPAARTKRVLIVDDSITVREVQRQLLANRGYLVDVAVDGRDGWRAARDGGYDLVISDLDMPGMDGIELVRSIKQNSGLRRTLVMIVSYRDREEDRRRGLEVGADYYLAKSDFENDALLAAVVELIGEAS
jgi:two-component system sensor histidine kinase and response regulator WspE